MPSWQRAKLIVPLAHSVTMPPARSPRGRTHGASTDIRRRTTSAGPGAPLRLALPATTEEVDPVMRDRETGASLHASRQRPRVRFGNRCLDVREAPAAETREVMVGAGVGVEAGSWPGQFTEQPRVGEQPKVPVDGGQAHPWRSADNQSVDFFGSGVRLAAPDHLEHRVARSVSRNPRSRSATSALSTPGGRASCSGLPTRVPGMILISINQPRPGNGHGTRAHAQCQQRDKKATVAYESANPSATCTPFSPALPLGRTSRAPRQASALSSTRLR
jgi:hypothetical protein